MKVSNSLIGHRAIGVNGNTNMKGSQTLKGKNIYLCIEVAAAMILLIAAIFLLWWKGIFLPRDIKWNDTRFSYEDSEVILENHRLKMSGTTFITPWDWCVQDVLCYDINHDKEKELVLLVWKHGNYGEHKPIWVEHNDIRLEQHIFIYKWDDTRDTRLRPIWMSSALGYQVSLINQGAKDSLVITDESGKSRAWQWENFGLKLIGDTKEERISFLAAGDNLIHPWILSFGDGDYHYFYENIKTQIEAADLASINQETIFVKERGLISDYPRFGTPLEVGEAIVDAGFDIVTLATNHALDQKLYGIDTTVDFYRNQDEMTYVGIHSSKEEADTSEEAVKIIEKKGIRIALLNDTYGTNGLPAPSEYPYAVERFSNEERLISQLEYAREEADIVIMFAHWGTEYSEDPDEYQRELYELLLTYGVDVVIGTHPHVLQPYEMLIGEDGHEMLVYYSLGNFISGQNRPECMVGGLAEFQIVRATDGTLSIQDYTLEKVITHQSHETCTVYPLETYTKEQASTHNIESMLSYLFQ